MPQAIDNMGIGWASGTTFKRQNRFILNIWGVTTGNTAPTKPGAEGEEITGTNIGAASRDPLSIMIWEKASRPSFSFKETEVNHLNETIYFAGRPDWKPLKVTLFDTMTKLNPVAEWISWVYGIYANKSRNFQTQTYYGSQEYSRQAEPAKKFKRNVTVTSLDGQGNPLEEWWYFNAWPQEVEFGDFDMTSTDIMRVNLTLRYDRAQWYGCTGDSTTVQSSN
jgi:hypothetical protein